MAALCFHLLPGSDLGDLGWATSRTGQPPGQPSPLPPWVKVCDADLIGQARANGVRCYYRPCFLPGDDGEGNCADGAAWAAKVIAAIQAAGGTWPDCLGYRNELQATAANAAEYQRYRAALRAAGYRGLVVYGSFAVGQPDWPDYATIPADADALETHEYWDLSIVGSSPWWALRHQEATQRGLLPATLPLFIGECGSDRIPGGTQPSIEDYPANRRGWNDSGKLSADDQATNLRSYAASCLPAVQAAFVFADGAANRQWDSYRTRGTPLEGVIRGTWQEAAMLRGIDVSDAQPGTDWQAVKASGVQFAAIKATEGVGWLSDTFYRDWEEAGAAGLTRCCYHFARPDLGNAAIDEASWFVSIVQSLLGPGDVPWLDLESGNGDLSGWASGWLTFASQMLASRKNLYSYGPFLEACNLTQQTTGADSLWLAAYQNRLPAAPAGWPGYLIWQRTSAAIVPGVATPVDEDYLYGSLDDLRRLGRQMLMDDLYEMQWKSRKADVALNPNAALFKDWLDRRRKGDYSLGVPLTDEFPHGAGVAQVMTNAIGTWDATNGVRWV